ncbi:MAG: invasion associated locus B family protein [Paracoccaceae bacterium]|nr:invasion associated locus B family protein [Paracoccaceae bacterium]MDG1737892.1 invasion associated locus B family protein [Paracoccaceae bacterium]MDG2259079.1 invasion associated locus B family protein [Paracoccaceae bacterium]
MFTKFLIVPTLAFAFFSGTAFAQEQTAPTEPAITYEDLADGDLYFRETFTDWKLRCQKDLDANDFCQLHQLLAGANGGTVAQISFFNLTSTDSAAVTGANITVPLETALSEGVKLKIDDKQAKAYPFTYCDSVGCHARLGFTAVELKWLQDGSSVKMATVPYRGSREPVVVEISLSGFTAGYTAVVNNNSR